MAKVTAQPMLPAPPGGTDATAGSPWRRSWRADPAAAALADRHYNRRARGAAQFVPPGRCLVLLTADRSAVWVTSWPLPQYVRHAWPGAWVCSLFRNEGEHLSSRLIAWAVAHTRAHWPSAPARGIVTFARPGQDPPRARPRPLLPPRGLAARRVHRRRPVRPPATPRRDARARAGPRHAARAVQHRGRGVTGGPRGAGEPSRATAAERPGGHGQPVGRAD